MREKRMKDILLILNLIFVLILVYSCEGEVNEGEFNNNELVDTKDGKSYNIKTIGETIWMTEDYSYKKSENIETDTSLEEIGYYTYTQANKYAFDGWELPTAGDWSKLAKFYNNDSIELANNFNLKYTDSFWLIDTVPEDVLCRIRGVTELGTIATNFNDSMIFLGCIPFTEEHKIRYIKRLNKW